MSRRIAGAGLLLAALVLTSACNPADFLATPKDVTVQVNAPLRAKLNEEFVLEVRVHNSAQRKQVLDSIDVGDRYLGGIALRGSEPRFKESFHVPIDNTQSYSFGLDIAPGATLVVKFPAVAVKAGDFSSKVDVCINSATSCLSQPVRTLVE